MNSLGEFIWAKSIHGNGFGNIRCVSANQDGDVFCTGEYFGTLDFDPGSSQFNLSNTGSEDIYAFKLDAEGSFSWAFDANSMGQNCGFGISAENGPSVCIAGFINDSLDLDPTTGEIVLQSSGERDVFIAKYSDCIALELVDTIHSCNSYTWIDGNTYYADTVLVDSSSSVQGCDSISIVHLNISTSYVDSISVSACGSYFWENTGMSYDSTITVVDSNFTSDGCDSVGVLELEVIHINTQVSFLFTDGLEAAPGYSYQWFRCEFDSLVLLPGGTSQSFFSSGHFAVQLTDSNGCVDTSDCYLIVGQRENQVEGKYSIVPNPSSTSFKIIPKPSEPYDLRIYSLSGNLLYSGFGLSNRLIEHNLVPGTYFVTMKLKNGELKYFRMICSD